MKKLTKKFITTFTEAPSLFNMGSLAIKTISTYHGGSKGRGKKHTYPKILIASDSVMWISFHKTLPLLAFDEVYHLKSKIFNFDVLTLELLNTKNYGQTM